MTMTPNSLPDDAGALKALVIAAGVENERLIAIIKELRRHRFGPRSEKIDPDQLALMLEDVEQSIAPGEAEAEAQESQKPGKAPAARKRRIIAARCPRTCRARTWSSTSPTTASAAGACGSRSARTHRSGST